MDFPDHLSGNHVGQLCKLRPICNRPPAAETFTSQRADAIGPQDAILPY
jgi:hypothetical protein